MINNISNKEASLNFIKSINKDSSNAYTSLETLKECCGSYAVRELKFKSHDSQKCECYKYLYETMSLDDNDNGYMQLIETMRLLDISSKDFTDYLLKSIRVIINSFNDVLCINTNDTLSRCKLNNITSTIARISKQEDVNTIKNCIDDLKWQRDQYNDILNK